MRQTACLGVKPVVVDSYAFLFNCMAAVRASDWMTSSTYKLSYVGCGLMLRLGLARRGPLVVFLSSDWQRALKSTLLCFIVMINLIFVFSRWCIDWVREPLYEPNFYVSCIKNYIGTQSEDLTTVKALKTLRWFVLPTMLRRWSWCNS